MGMPENSGLNTRITYWSRSGNDDEIFDKCRTWSPAIILHRLFQAFLGSCRIKESHEEVEGSRRTRLLHNHWSIEYTLTFLLVNCIHTRNEVFLGVVSFRSPYQCVINGVQFKGARACIDFRSSAHDFKYLSGLEDDWMETSFEDQSPAIKPLATIHNELSTN